AETVDAADVGEYGNGECLEHFVTDRVTVGIVDALEPVEIDQGYRTGRAGPMRPRNFVVEEAQDATAIERAGEIVKFGKLFDAPVGLLEREAALVKRFTHRTGKDTEKHAAAAGQHKHHHRCQAFQVSAVRHRDRLVWPP